MIELLTLPASAVTGLIEDVRRFGRDRVETGGFLVAAAAAPTEISTVALAGMIGISRRRDMFAVSGRALEKLFTWAADNDLRITAQFHSHAGRPFLSPVDVRHGLSVRGFISCVVPSFSDPPKDPGRWGWWQFDGDEWIEIAAPQTRTTDPVSVIAFDEGGVR